MVATFSSSIYRMQVLVDLAAQFERRVAFVGRSMVQTTEIAQRLGYLRVPSGVQIKDSDVRVLRGPDEVLCITTGSQGEPQAALSRIAIDDHRFVHLSPDDTVVLSARAIPGNEKAIGRTMSHVARRGAQRDHGRQQARARVRPRLRGGAQADAVAGAAALLRADPRRIPAAGAARPRSRARC